MVDAVCHVLQIVEKMGVISGFSTLYASAQPEMVLPDLGPSDVRGHFRTYTRLLLMRSKIVVEKRTIFNDS